MTRTRLLIVHPDPSTLGMLGSMLRSLNCEIMEAEDDSTALRGLDKQPNLVFLGVDSGRPDALELFYSIRRSRPECPVIVLFTSPHPVLATRASRMGAVAVLMFPLPANQLRAAVVQALDSGADIPEMANDRQDEAMDAPEPRDDEPNEPEVPVPCCDSTEAPIPCNDLYETHPVDKPSIKTLKEALEGPEREIILQRLETLGWNLRKTADALGIDRTTLYKKMKKYGLYFVRELNIVNHVSNSASDIRKMRMETA